MSDEINQRSYSRRRLTPVYDEIEETTESRIKNPVFEKIRDPFTALQEAEEKQKKKVEESTMSTPDLKALLKQSGGLSLSEVLQQKNLSLAELLKGNQQAISALARQTEATTETAVSTDSPKYRRLPPSVGLKKVTNRNFEHNYEQDDDLTSHEVLEAQRKRLALLHGHKDTKMFSDVTRFDVVTEETTEKRIFVPSNSKFYTSVDYKPEILFKGVTTTPVPTTTPTAKAGPVSFRSRTRELPLTSAKLNKFVSKSTDEARIPAKAVTININEIFGFSVADGKNSTEASDGPFKMTIDLGEIVTTEAARDEENVIQIKTVSPVEFSDELKITTATSIADKLKHVTAKEEIMEILKNPADREYLSRILQTRNMTVEELVEQRERGSSQLHLADIFHNKTREPEPKDEPFIGHINSANFNSFPFFNRKSKSRAMSTTSKPPLRTDKQLVTTKPPYTITSFPTFKIETNKNFKTQPFLPVWKQLYPSLFTDVYENNHYDDHTEFAKTTTPTTRKMNYDLESLEDIENTLAEAANSKRNLHHQNIYDDNEFISLPTGVKSAILASLAIIGLSLLVFLTILVVFKWTQKQKRRLNYNGSFSGSKIKSPILEPDQKRSFKMFMTETLGRKKNYYKSHLQSMSDTIWDDGEKKSYMI
ncbi:hypothetical protein BDFB_001144 [Asbolus verrucosus]|uniref:Uncharacterized protein n=1 Tax=Asbolus verrucosus TaxID=1661398 RepID=A0A482W985_ASBVE|nr:hypothetical protein BDFB_001144 [Asbolus verrucosus]